MNIVKTWAMAILTTAALLLFGCASAKLPTGLIGERNSVSASDIAVSVEVPKRFFNVGEKFTAVISVRNLTGQPVTIPAGSGAPVFVRLWRYTPLGEVEVKQYPQFDSMVMHDWTLQPNEVRSFPLGLTVEPDWPRGELMRLTGEVNGRPQLQPGIMISVNLQET